jgi:hypothetical protein
MVQAKVVLRYGHKIMEINFDLSSLFKWVRLINFISLILCWDRKLCKKLLVIRIKCVYIYITHPI